MASTISRFEWVWPADYCSVANGRCPYEAPPTPEDRSAFVAYSSEPRSADDMRRLAARQHVLGATMTTWEGLRRAGVSIIFCDICKALFRSNLAIFEITDLNQNVLFEFGYALGKGRRCVLLRNERIRSRRIQLVTDVRYVPYNTTEDVIADLRRVDPFTEESLGQALLRLCSESRDRPDNCSILHLQTGAGSDATLLVQRALKKLKRAETLAEDPRQSFSHQLFELAKRLAGADIVVANLETKDARGAEERNAQTSLLAGMALAFQKRVLVLQEQPAEHLVDLKGVLQEYRTATEARTRARDLQQVVDDIVAARRQQPRQLGLPGIQVRPSGIDLLSFGQPAAEQEAEGLRDYFLPTPAFDAARDGSRWLFVGRRGTGKSANCLQLAWELSAAPRNVVSLVRPIGVQLRTIKSTLERHFDERDRAYIFESVWTYILFTEMARAILDDMDRKAPLWEPDQIRRLAEWQDQNSDEIDLELDERLISALETAGEGIDSSTHWSPNGTKVEKLYRTRASRIESLIRSLLTDRNAYVLIDNLDKDWEEADPISARLIVGLLAAADRIASSSLRGKARIIVFLREDIQRSVQQYDQDSEKRTWMDLQWDEQLLLSLVGERIRQTMGLGQEMSDEEVWAACFDKTVNGVESHRYILERTLLRPRHAIWYCNRALDIARRRGRARILAEDVLRAERDYSEQVLNNLSWESSSSQHDLTALALQFCDAPAQMDELEVKTRLERSAREAGQGRGVQPGWSAEAALRFLYDVGFLGVVLTSGDAQYGHVDPSYERAAARARLVVPTGERPALARVEFVLSRLCPPLARRVRRHKLVPLYCVHPAFWRCLDIRSADFAAQPD